MVNLARLAPPGGGLKLLLPEYKNQELNKGLTEAQEQAVGDQQ